MVIKGDLKAKNIVTGGNLEVQGDIMAEEAIIGDWYHAGAEVFGNVKCKLMYSNFHNFNIRGTLDAEYPIDLSVEFVQFSNDVKEISLEKFKKLDVHDLKFPEPLEEEGPWDDFLGFVLRISKGKSIFKA